MYLENLLDTTSFKSVFWVPLGVFYLRHVKLLVGLEHLFNFTYNDLV